MHASLESVRSLVLLCLALASGGCVIQTKDADPNLVRDAGIEAAPSEKYAEVRATMGPAGGVLTHPLGASLMIPAGALQAEVELAIIGVDTPAVLQIGGVALSQGFLLEPEALALSMPAVITLPCDASLLNDGGNWESVRLVLSGEGGLMHQIRGAVDPLSATVSGDALRLGLAVASSMQEPLTISTSASLPAAEQSSFYMVELVATGAAEPFEWELVNGVLPAGLGIVSGGKVQGTPLEQGLFMFAARARAGRVSIDAPFSLQVLAPGAHPVPELQSVTPDTVVGGGPDLTLTLEGSLFVEVSTVRWDNDALATQYVSGSMLQALVPSAFVALPGSHQVRVVNPAPGGGESQVLIFTVLPPEPNPIPAVTSISPSTVALGTADVTLTIQGTGFIGQTVGVVAGSQLSTQYVSPTEVNATLPGSLLGAPATLHVGVFNPPPGGGHSNTMPVKVGL